jgi:CheY-like chemotaxis protein
MLARLWGHDVRVTSDGPAALALAAEFQPQVALVDIGLPGMDGYAVAQHLREVSKSNELYLVAMTGYGRERDLAAARAAGFDTHLVKPADMDELRSILAKRPAPLS